MGIRDEPVKGFQSEKKRGLFWVRESSDGGGGGGGAVGIWVWAAESGFGPRTFNGMFLAFERKMGLFLVFCLIFWQNEGFFFCVCIIYGP